MLSGGEDRGAELERLRRRLRRERGRREAAEQIGDQLTSELYAAVEELQRVQAELLERADWAKMVEQVGRRLRQAQDIGTLVQRAAAETGLLVGADRCQAHVSAPSLSPAVGDWSGGVELPHPVPLNQLPAPLVARFADWSDPQPVVVEDIAADLCLAPARRSVITALGCRSLVAVPIRAATRHLGWVLLLDVEPRRWGERELVVCDGIALDVGARVLELQAAEQRESVRRLEALDRAKDQLISTVSHELRTPLTSIRGYLELLDSGDLGPLEAGPGNAVRVIARNAGRLKSLVENLLRSSAKGPGRLLDLREVDLGEVAAECHRSMGPTLSSRELALSMAVAPDLGHLLTDRELVEQVVLNLVSNAIKFTPPGGEVTITLDNTDAGVALAVADTGIGIPEDELGAVFSRFFRSSLSVAGEIQGVGLGLSVTKSIVDLLGGRVYVQSAQGVGTTVRVELPADPAAQRAAAG